MQTEKKPLSSSELPETSRKSYSRTDTVKRYTDIHHEDINKIAKTLRNKRKHL